MRTLLSLTFLGLAFSTRATIAAETGRHNVLLLIADDLGLEVGCYGNKTIKTPNIDALAKNGSRFTDAFATVSSCSPSRASIYTGLFTHTSGQYGLAHASHHFRTHENVKSLPSLLKPAGYRTGILGKIHVEPRSVYPFDEEITQGLAGNRSVAVMAKKARQFVSDAGDKPFCLVVGFSDPHRAARGFANESKYPDVPVTAYDPKGVPLPYFIPDQPEARKDVADYYQSVSRLDHGVGLMMAVLKDTGHADDTLVIFLSDNGIPWPGAKTTLYDPGIHLPLIVSSPAQTKRGIANPNMASYVDILPTILDWAKVKAPADLPGRSLLPILESTKRSADWEIVYGSHQCHEVTMYYPMRMVRTAKYKYIMNLAHKLDYPFSSDLYNSPTWQGIKKRGDKAIGTRDLARYVNRPREELYDLEKDPNELKNVAGDEAYASVLTELRGKLKAWQEKTNDPWLVKYEHE
jgi:N-sulfoglucosamine sulfohydrolase